MTKARAVDHYSPARRLHQLKAMLNSSGGLTVYEIAERLDVSVRTAIRYMRALEKAEEPLYSEADGRRKVYRLKPNARHETLTLTTGQMLALFVSRRAFDFLDGTGLKEDLDDVFARLESTLRRRDFGATRHLDRKVFDVNEAPHVYTGRIEDMNDVTTALLRDERLRVRHTSIGSGHTKFVIDPYTLLIYKKGVYIVGYSHHHGAIRTLALDGIREVEWLKGDRFTYPTDYDPARLTEGAFGLFGGERERVRIFFEEKVARFVRRRRWHPSQKIKTVKGGIELTMNVAAKFELETWVLGFGDTAEVLSPPGLRDRVAAELRRAAARYQ